MAFARADALVPPDDSPKLLHWDEATIAEHDKLRGTRQKIDEPDTPYNYDFDEEQLRVDAPCPSGNAATASRGLPTSAADASLQLAALTQRLEAEEAKQAKGVDLNWAAHDPDCDDAVQATKRRKFASRRFVRPVLYGGHTWLCSCLDARWTLPSAG